MRRIDPATLQASVQAIAEELAEAIKAKGYPDAFAKIEFKSGGTVWVWFGGVPDDGDPLRKHVWGESLDEALTGIRAKIELLPRQPTHEEIGRTLGIVEAQP